jgi:hypothetical protein
MKIHALPPPRYPVKVQQHLPEPSGGHIADRLIAIGQDCARRLSEPYRSLDHGDFLYGENGLPETLQVLGPDCNSTP